MTVQPDPRLRSYPRAVITYVEEGAQDDARFCPDYQPQQMVLMGVFGDAYFGGKLGAERLALLPRRWWFTKSGVFYTNMRGRQCKEINYHGRPASLKRDWWLDKGLIVDIDPLGWFEWYCHYFLGRRVSQYDDWQIDRWLRFRGRQTRMYWARPTPGTAQALLHWGIRAETFLNKRC